MHCRALMSSMFVCLVLMGAGISAQMLGTDHANFAASGERSNLQTSPGGAQTTQPIRNPAELADRIFKREKAQVETIENSAPIVETYIQEEKSDALMGTIPKNDFYFLGQADFRGKTMKVHSMTARAHKGSIMWSYEPAGFLQMAFLDLRDFDKEHYRLRAGQRVFLGEVRCLFLMWTARRKLKDHDFKAESGSKIRTSPSFASTGPTRRRETFR